MSNITISNGIHHNKNIIGGKFTKLTEKMSMQISLSQILINKDLHANTDIHLNMYDRFSHHLVSLVVVNNIGRNSCNFTTLILSMFKFLWIEILFQYQNVETLF